MKKTLKLIIALALVASLAFSVVGCFAPKTQGIDSENFIINVGNTAATSGAFAGVGVPFNYDQ